MALSSMTGFARGHGVAGSYAWAWELKSVNSKGLDLKLRLPPGWEAIEPGVRARASEILSRGSVFANLTVSREGAPPVARINEPALNAVLAALKGLEGKVAGAPPSLDGILSLKGVMEVSEAEESEDERSAAEVAVVAGFGQALKRLAEMRRKPIGGDERARAVHSNGTLGSGSGEPSHDGTGRFLARRNSGLNSFD